uniref:ER membrane protein complex subunit 10 n=1 Tax=Mesocestoides corti TaxID=53468 RepID=A0A5K3EN56_MESCO
MILRVYLTCVVILVASALSDDNIDPLDVTIEQSFDQGKSFTPKGVLSSWSGVEKNLLLSESPLTDADKSAIEKLSLSNSLYIVRAFTNSSSSVLVGSCQACQLLASEGKLALILSVDASGSPVAITVIPKNRTCTENVRFPASVTQLSTSVIFQRPSLFVGPETQEYVAKMDRQREEKLRQDQLDNRSFLAKYWMYILPAVFFFILLNTADPNASGGSE